jgi:transposase
MDLGYPGQLTQLRGYLRSVRPVQEPEKLIRFETPPGKQMQVDWIEFRKGKNPLAAFVATLGYSRVSYVEFVVNQKVDTLIQCHKNAFDYFGGAPAEALYDNMKTVIVSRDTYCSGMHRFNSAMLDFAKHCSFTLKVCKPYRAKTKGKVERFNRYLRYSFYNPLSSKLKAAGLVLDSDTANIEVLKWLEVTANTRVHGTTGEVPQERLEIEKSYLQKVSMDYHGITSCKVISAQQNLDRAAATTLKPKPQVFSTTALQHPLSVYDQILGAV